MWALDGLRRCGFLWVCLPGAACTQAEVDSAFAGAKKAQKAWAKTPLWKRAELIHKAAALMRENAAPMAEILVQEVAKAAKDSLAEVNRSADLMDYTAEEGLRVLSEGKLLTSDPFPGNDRNKLCLAQKVCRSAPPHPWSLLVTSP